MKIYCDGAVSNNGYSNAIGGWAFVILGENDELIHIGQGGEAGATNQQMELTALAQACMCAYLNVENFENEHFVVYSDSAYIVNCYEQRWWTAWQNNGWRNAQKKTVKNRDLWEEVIPFFKNKNFDFIKVKGHNGDWWNEYVDKLAVEAKGT